MVEYLPINFYLKWIGVGLSSVECCGYLRNNYAPKGLK